MQGALKIISHYFSIIYKLTCSCTFYTIRLMNLVKKKKKKAVLFLSYYIKAFALGQHFLPFFAGCAPL